MKKEMVDQVRLVMNKFDEQIQVLAEIKQETKKELNELRGEIKQVRETTQAIELHTAGLCPTVCKVFRFDQYTQRKGTGIKKGASSDKVHFHQHGYKFRLHIEVHDDCQESDVHVLPDVPARNWHNYTII